MLTDADGRAVSIEDLVTSAYSDRPDGGPLNAHDVVKTTLMGLRRIGVPIESTQEYRIISRVVPRLSRQQTAIVDVIRSDGGLGGRREIARRLGMRPNAVSVVINVLARKGVRIEPISGYRLTAPCPSSVARILADPVGRRRPAPKREPVQRRAGVNAMGMKAFTVLHKANGQLVAWDVLHDALYGHCIDGGPDEGVARAIAWLGSMGADVRREHRYVLPASWRRCGVTRPSGLAVIRAIRQGHDDLDGIVAATGMTRNAVLTAISRMVNDDHYEIESRQGYRLHWHVVDQIHQLAA